MARLIVSSTQLSQSVDGSVDIRAEAEVHAHIDHQLLGERCRSFESNADHPPETIWGRGGALSGALAP